MSAVGATAGVLLAGVLAWAAVAKLRAPEATAATFRRLGLPGAAPLARAVPVLELLAAGLLLVVPPVGALLSVALLSAFTALLGSIVAGGEPVACGCFGGAGDAPVGPADLVRNVGLLAAAAVALGGVRGEVTLEAAILTSTAAVVVLMVQGLVRLRGELGVVWDVTLPGEPQAP